MGIFDLFQINALGGLNSGQPEETPPTNSLLGTAAEQQVGEDSVESMECGDVVVVNPASCTTASCTTSQSNETNTESKEWVLLVGDKRRGAMDAVITNVERDRLRFRPKVLGSATSSSDLLDRSGASPSADGKPKTNSTSTPLSMPMSYAAMASKSATTLQST